MYLAWKLHKGHQLVPVMDWTGRTMVHCPVIEHEDIGKMGVWDIMDMPTQQNFAGRLL
jgi:hypothetical protein